MKILSPSQIYLADQATIKNDNITSLDLMERAGMRCCEWILSDKISKNHPTFYIFCGVGNNGGDGLVIARLLLAKGFIVKSFIVNFSQKKSPEFEANLVWLKSQNYQPKNIDAITDFPLIPKDAIIIDAIFGLGIKRAPEGFTKSLIQYLNQSQNYILSIDFPSGLFAETAVFDKESVIKAAHTLTFQCPKRAFLLPENQYFTQSWAVLDIGLNMDFINTLSVEAELVSKSDVLAFYKKRLPFSHKGTYGHTLLIGGSYGKIGSMVLALKAANKMGSGLVTGLVPECAYQIIQSQVPEAMCITNGKIGLSNFHNKINANAIGIGMGMGLDQKTQEAFLTFLAKNKTPLVIDADALNCLALHPEALKLVPKNSILTPHPKELERLIGSWNHDDVKLERLKKLSLKHQIIVVLKGAHTLIVNREQLYFNSTGNPALATGGSGDVLSGLITGLLAQHYEPLQAAILGVYLHGLTADIAIKTDLTCETFIASDIINYLPKAFKQLLNTDK
ncbi:MAG: bifunctional ADP-dependent NAD(P)H-hydrate dehydratase/NAD(P)H-hydrate epimerase [Flavobacteriales bacterium CG03_land_8_20_14_0_80_35_15]|nr:MAG: bifunctional ADP-dependent NAD(P)H-hydrate dehydratase/NAD(P)H-hydrate epimerase [Flavobacteriales bacterium CG03_land_8_20_14_0_80_35_15]